MIKLTELLKKTNKSLENIDNLYLAVLTGNPNAGSRGSAPNYALNGSGRNGLSVATNLSSPISINDVESKILNFSHVFWDYWFDNMSLYFKSV